MSFEDGCTLAVRILSWPTLIFQLWYDGRLLWHIKRFSDPFYICLLSISVAGIVHLSYSAFNLYACNLTVESCFWPMAICDNLTFYAEIFNMLHIAIVRAAAVTSTEAFDKVTKKITTTIFVCLAWTIGICGSGSTPFIWKVEFNQTLSVMTSFYVPQAFTITEETYVYGCITTSFVLHMFTYTRLRLRNRKLNKTKTDNVGGKQETKLLIQAFLGNLVLIVARIVIVARTSGGDPTLFSVLTGIYLLLMWLHYSMSPILSAIMSTEILNLVLCRKDYKVKMNSISTIVTNF